MKITCQSCQAKYTIADEKVAGKTVKIRCKKCSATIVVQGDANAAPPSGRAPAQTMDPSYVTGQAPGGDEEVETRVFGGDPGMAPPGGAADEWTVNVSDTDQRTLTTTQLVYEFQRGTLTTDTYVWKDGMGDWMPITSVPELAPLLMAGAGAPALPAAGVVGLSGTIAMDQPVMSPFAAQARPGAGAAAAKKPGRAGAVDLFGAQQAPAAADMAAPPSASGDRLVGERNENSVLFSLSALTGAQTAARAEMERDVRAPSAAPKNNGGRAGFDDIMNMGGGMAAPMLAPPSLIAPVVEAPPPPPPMAAQANPAYPSPGMGYAPPQPQPKSKAGIFIALAIVVVGLGGVAAFVLTRPPAPSTEAANTASAPTGAAPQPTAAKTTASAAASAAPSAAPAADTASAAPADTGAASAEPQAANDKHAPTGGPGGRHDDKKKDAREERREEKKTAVAEAPPPAKEEKKAEAPASGGGEFDRAAAMSALGGAAGAASGCKKPDGPTGSGRVRVTFAPSGTVTSASVDGPPFAGTPVGGCVAAAFRNAHVPPFAGSPVAVSKSFSIN
jgi:predicted Zn finger-like uncharacterized protein